MTYSREQYDEDLGRYQKWLEAETTDAMLDSKVQRAALLIETAKLRLQNCDEYYSTAVTEQLVNLLAGQPTLNVTPEFMLAAEKALAKKLDYDIDYTRMGK